MAGNISDYSRKKFREGGGVDIIQFVVALIIIGVAAVSATFSLFVGKGALDSEWRQKRALELARNEMEYWTAMVYKGQEEDVNQRNALPVRLINKRIVREKVLLDARSEDSNNDDIYCEIIRPPLELNQLAKSQTGLEIYKIKVHVIWEEPSENPNLEFEPDTVSLESWMVYEESL